MAEATRQLSIRLAAFGGDQVKRELRAVGDEGSRALTRITDAANGPSRGLVALNAAGMELSTGLQGLAGRAGQFGTTLQALGPAGLAAGAALGGLVALLAEGLTSTAEADRSLERLKAVLKATGHAAGLTAQELADFADEVEDSTMATAEAVQDAASVLATFRSVSGETFTRALTLAQDMAAVFGQDLRSSAVQLGKALEDPVEGISALKRVGVSFTDSQKDLIASLVGTGRAAEAQRVILDALEEQVGGAGKGETKGLTGAVNGLTDAWGNFAEEVARTSGLAKLTEDALHLMAQDFKDLAEAVKGPSIAEQVAEKSRELLDLKKAIRAEEAVANQASPISTWFLDSRVESLKAEADALDAEIAALVDKGRQETEAAVTEREEAEKGRQTAAAEQRAELVRGIEKKLQEDLAKLATDRIAKVREEEAKAIADLEQLRTRGAEPAKVDDLIGLAHQRAGLQIAEIQKPEIEAAQRRAEANGKVVKSIAEELDLLHRSDRERAVEQAVRRLSAEATDAQVERVRALAGALFDEKTALEQSTKASEERRRQQESDAKVLTDLAHQNEKTALPERDRSVAEVVDRLSPAASPEMRGEVARLAEALYDETEAQRGANDMRREAARIFEETRTGAERHQEELAHLREMLDAGAISQDTFNRAAAKAAEDLKKSQEDAAGFGAQAWKAGLGSIGREIEDFVTTGEFSFQRLEQAIIASITRIAVEQAIIKPMEGLFSGLFAGEGGGASLFSGVGSFLAGLFHEGGVVGERPLALRPVPAALFADAPRYHGGGVAGAPWLAADEVPIIARKGEVITPPEKIGRGGEAPPTIVMNITTPDAHSFRASQGQIAAEMARAVTRGRRNL